MINILKYDIEKQMYRAGLTKANKQIVFFCVGNGKIWYDSFGPMFAEELRKSNFSCFVYGGVNFPIIPDNLIEYMDFVEKKHPNAIIFVVDNCLSQDQSPNKIIFKHTSTIPAGLINTHEFGTYSILLKTSNLQDYKKHILFQTAAIKTIIEKLQSTYLKM